MITGFSANPITVTPVARTDEPRRETPRESIPHQKLVRTLPTVELPSYKDEVHPHNFMVEQPKNKILELLPKDSVRRRHSCIGKRASRKKCVLVPITLRKQCVGQKKSRSLLHLTTLRRRKSISGSQFPNFVTLDAKIAASLKKFIQHSNIRKVHLEEQKAQKIDRFFRGRHITDMIYEYFFMMGTHEAVVDYSHLSI